MHLALNIFIRFCSLANNQVCETYIGFSDIKPGYSLEVCQKAAESLALDKLSELDWSVTKYFDKAWCEYNIEQRS